ncbi:hypothetical protein [Paraferrimonas sedimenticola]|uniref:Uncharacterized protein n=1 Tax=Paraferrimonas sedimenticola TaxID=375674 RepID=A0AA37VUI0_9GAMM|nr:hypothetical protein [Paraferrimonas sedimenticola]GLP95666.1 hypothetical protein GCM10007895_09720 [Paraferrimonas sedimenticola]
MSLAALALAAAVQWLPVGAKQSLVCELHQAQQCIAQLPSELRQAFYQAEPDFPESLGMRQAVSYVFDHPELVGVVLLANPHQNQRFSQFLHSGWHNYQVENEAQLVRLHELGHLHAQAIPEQWLPLPEQISTHDWQAKRYRQEVYADLYLAWKMAAIEASWSSIQAQINRRNLAMMSRKRDLTHWTVPYLALVVEQFTAQQVASWPYDQFVQKVMQSAAPLQGLQLNELAFLFRAEFSGKTPKQSNQYLSWRRKEFGEYVAPTITALMGASAANQWLARRRFI